MKTRTPDWEQMPYFLAAARSGSLRAAASELGATHGTVNRHVKALETAYGVRLFDRAQTGLELTVAGRALMPLAEQAENLFFAARRNLQGLDRQETGTVRFSVTGSVAYEIVAPILVKFFEAHPGIDIEIRVGDRFEDINKLETDVSLRFAADVTDDVVARKLFPMALGTFSSQSYLEKYLLRAGPNGEGLHWIGWDEINLSPDWIKYTAFPKAEVRHATIDHVMQIALARNGFGMVNTSTYIARSFPELMPVPGGIVTRDWSLWLLLHSELRRTTRVRRFVDFLADELMKLRTQIEGQ